MQAYGEILRDVLDGNPLLSLRSDAAELGWHIMDPVLKAWADDRVPMGGVRRRVCRSRQLVAARLRRLLTRAWERAAAG